MAKGAQAEYTNLVGYFKHLVWITGIFLVIAVAVAGFLFDSTLNEIRADAKVQAIRIANEESAKAVKAALEQDNINKLIEQGVQTKIAAITDRMIEEQVASKLQPIQHRIFYMVKTMVQLKAHTCGYGGFNVAYNIQDRDELRKQLRVGTASEKDIATILAPVNSQIRNDLANQIISECQDGKRKQGESPQQANAFCSQLLFLLGSRPTSDGLDKATQLLRDSKITSPELEETISLYRKFLAGGSMTFDW